MHTDIHTYIHIYTYGISITSVEAAEAHTLSNSVEGTFIQTYIHIFIYTHTRPQHSIP